MRSPRNNIKSVPYSFIIRIIICTTNVAQCNPNTVWKHKYTCKKVHDLLICIHDKRSSTRLVKKNQKIIIKIIQNIQINLKYSWKYVIKILTLKYESKIKIILIKSCTSYGILSIQKHQFLDKLLHIRSKLLKHFRQSHITVLAGRRRVSSQQML